MNDRIYYSREAEQLAQQQRTILALLVMMMGLGAGVVIALLFAPRKGEEVRRELTHQAEHAYDNSREATSKAVERLQKDFDKLRGDVEERMKHVQR